MVPTNGASYEPLNRKCVAIRSSSCCQLGGPYLLHAFMSLFFFAGLVDFVININHIVRFSVGWVTRIFLRPGSFLVPYVPLCVRHSRDHALTPVSSGIQKKALYTIVFHLGERRGRNAVEATGWEQGGRDGGGFMGLEKLEGLVSLRRGFYKGGQHIVSR